MSLFLLVGLSGLLGSGPFSTATVASGPLQFRSVSTPLWPPAMPPPLLDSDPKTALFATTLASSVTVVFVPLLKMPPPAPRARSPDCPPPSTA